jgi:hypothetical protein
VEAARSERPKEEADVVDITIDSVIRVRVSAIEENEIDEDDEDEDEEPYYRTLTIVTASGEVIELDLYAASPAALEIDEDEE